MAMLCALDWRHYGVIATLTQDAAGGARLVLSHGADELVVHLSWAEPRRPHVRRAPVPAPDRAPTRGPARA